MKPAARLAAAGVAAGLAVASILVFPLDIDADVTPRTVVIPAPQGDPAELHRGRFVLGPAPQRWQAFEVAVWQIANRDFHGGTELVLDPTLNEFAQEQADLMAAAGTIWHQDLYAVTARGWTAAGENVAYGPNTWTAHAAMCWSPPHLANMLNPVWRNIGVGVAMRPDGQSFVSVVFGTTR